jgi:DNA-binding XRE family transcriptional regulator
MDYEVYLVFNNSEYTTICITMQTSYKDDLLKRISNNLKRFRLEHNYSQAFVAENIDISLRTYQTYESDDTYDIRISHMVRIAEFYGVMVDDLLK